MDQAKPFEAWDFQRPLGRLQHQRLVGQVDVRRPAAGMHLLQFDSQPLVGSLLGTAWCSPSAGEGLEAPLAEAYARGNDLVACYAPTHDWPYSSQIYWRLEESYAVAGALAGAMLMVSVETDLLDSHPRINVSTQLAADEALFLELDDQHADARSLDARPPGEKTLITRCGCLLLRLPDGKTSYAEMAHPSDFQELTVTGEQSKSWQVSWQLFAHFLEKGVIRRARMVGAFLPRADDVAIATACYRTMINSPLPLTT